MELDLYKHLHSTLDLAVEDELAKKQLLSLFIDSETEIYNRAIDDLEASLDTSTNTHPEIKQRLREMRLSFSKHRERESRQKRGKLAHIVPIRTQKTTTILGTGSLTIDDE